MGRIVQIKKNGKVKKAEGAAVKTLQEYGALGIDAKVEAIQQMIPLALMHALDMIENDVRQLAGERYGRNGIPGYDRWGKQEGSICLHDQRIPIQYTRVRDTKKRKEASNPSYIQLHRPAAEVDDRLMKRVLYGISCKNYRECAELIPQAFSLSASTVSRKYIRATLEKLQELQERSLEGYDFVALLIDGKAFGDDELIIALGVTISGEKIPLGFVQSGAENARVTKDFLNGLIERGLRYDKGLLCIIDGAKGFRKAVDDVFGAHGVIQRCQWHKRENVVDYLRKDLQPAFRDKLRRAYAKEGYGEAKSALQTLKKELRLMNESAVTSLEEGFEETLAIHRLGVAKELRKSLSTTNMIESVNALIGQRTDKVDRWRNSNQKQRWVATALLDIEPRLNRVSGYRHLPALRAALISEVKRASGQESKKEAAVA
ncbi:MAG: transposase [Nitrospirae bacterium]|nr:transposase [Nitrospirota bacterium]